MRKSLRKFLAAAMALALIVCLCTPAYAAFAPAKKLQFNEDGKFTIIQFADCQDDFFTSTGMIAVMKAAIDKHQPDLVVFTGDNIAGVFTKLMAKTAIDNLLSPVVDAGVPFAAVFGNHDAEDISKSYQIAQYQKNPGCMMYDAVPDLTGAATYNLPILSSDGTRDAFNLWMIDSNMYEEDESIGGYDYVHQDQLDWYTKTSKQLEYKNGGLVPSLAFQHIIVPEAYELLKEAPAGAAGDNIVSYGGKSYCLELKDKAQGVVNESPGPSRTNSGELATMAARGDVLGIVTGHDHVNSFIGTVDGVDLIQTPGVGYQSYGDPSVRGYRVIELNENDAWNYTTETYTFFDLFGDNKVSRALNKYYESRVENGFQFVGVVFEIILPVFFLFGNADLALTKLLVKFLIGNK